MRLAFAVSLLFAFRALAQPVDVAALYELTSEATKVKAGGQGNVVIAFKLKEGAHLSEEAPLKIELSSKQAKLAKDKFTLADALDAKGTPRFEASFTAPAATSIDAKLTFFICTAKLCARQSRQLSIPVEVL